MRLVFHPLVPACALLLAAASGCSSGKQSSPNTGTAGAAGEGAGTTALVCKADEHPTSPLSLLTRVQYDATVADLLGDTSNPSASFPPENQVSGYNNNTAVHIANPLLVEQFMDAAEAISGRAVAANLSTLSPCAGTTVAEQTACGTTFINTFGKRAFRRPLLTDEAQAFNTLFAGMTASRGYSAAVELTIQAFLQSPQFLYRADTSRAATPETGAVALDPYQLASRLSYFLTGSMPDDALFAAADAGKLLSASEIETQARRLLETPKARLMVRDFNQQWLGLSGLAGLARNSPDATTDVKGIGDDYRESLLQFLDSAYWDKGDLNSLFLSPDIYVNARLAGVFGVNAPASGYAKVSGAPGEVGLLTQPALLSMLAHSDQSGPVQRGVFVRQQILCNPVPPPPANLNPVAPDPDPTLTTRERFGVHTMNPACSGCHKLIDGTGFGFENYDQFGRYRTEENGLPVDASGEIIGMGGGLDGTFVGAEELSKRIAGSARAQNCLATNWFRYAMGRVETEADGCSVIDVQKKFVASGGQFKELLVALTQTDAFRYRAALPEDM
ncbi:MAG: DUF1588 domain-containing protein [Polyangiaceae bacterium]